VLGRPQRPGRTTSGSALRPGRLSYNVGDNNGAAFGVAHHTNANDVQILNSANRPSARTCAVRPVTVTRMGKL